MRIAYIISAYKYPEQLFRLVHKLNTERTFFFIHVDKRTDQSVYDQIVGRTRNMANVRFLKRHRCYWGGFGHVKATIKGINEILKGNDLFDYVVLLTGQDYPIKPNNYIEDFFRRYNGNSFMEYFPLPCAQWQNGGLERIRRWHFRFYNRYFTFPKSTTFPVQRKFLSGFQPFGGSSYWCLTRECVEYIHDFLMENRSFVNYFRFVDIPDEIFFHTIILNSPLKKSVINNDLRYIHWNGPDAGSPTILRKLNFNKIATSPKLFARKFDATIDANILDLIDQQILAPSNK